MKLSIITGGSKGLGDSLVKTYCRKGYTTISIARTKSSFKHSNLSQQIIFDLVQVNSFDTLEKILFSSFEVSDIESVVLINNAGIIGEIKPLDKRTNTDIIETNQINLTAPLLFTAMIIRKFKTENIPVQIINISSGAGINPYFGWSGYNATKAGIEMMAKTIALEQAENKNFRILNIKPGVVDTNMQKQIRRADETDFPIKNRFVDLYKNNLLLKPDKIALMIYNIYLDKSFDSGSSLDIRNI